MVEHFLGKGGVVSPILTSGTIKKASLAEAFFYGNIGRTELRSKSETSLSAAREERPRQHLVVRASRKVKLSVAAHSCQRHHL